MWALVLKLIFNHPKMKNNMKNIIKFSCLAIAGVCIIALGGCKKKFLDVNQNPNNPEMVDVKYVLPAGQQAIAYSMGNQFAIVGGLWSQYWTQGPNANQYNDLDRYAYNATDANYPWSQMYAQGLRNLDFVYHKGLDEKKRNYAAVARLMEAYGFQVMTDAFGDVPFTEAILGDSTGNVNPKFDGQDRIYAALEVMIDSGITLIDPAAAGPGSNDLVYGGDMAKWKRFGNTLKLKVYLRQIYKNPGISAKITSFLATSPDFLGLGDDATMGYTSDLGSQNPLHASFSALTNYNLLASNTAINYLLATNDTRILDFYNPADNTGLFNGIDQGGGKLLAGAQNNGSFSFPNDNVTGATARVRLLTASESLFLQAEAQARGFGSGDGQLEYENAITASWATWPNAASDTSLATFIVSDSIAYPSSMSMRIRSIITQKWVSMCGNQNLEAWIEWRRTGFPDFFIQSKTSILGSGKFPRRLLYPSDEITSNSNFPGQKLLTDKVWWDAH